MLPTRQGDWQDWGDDDPAENKALCRTRTPAVVTMDGIPVLVLFSLKNRDEGTCLWGTGYRAGPRGICSGCVTGGAVCGHEPDTGESGEGASLQEPSHSESSYVSS